MVELLKAQTGELTLRYGDQLLASKYDPKSEAKKWVQKVAPTIIGVRSVVVLSAGAGHHLVELRNQFPHLKLLALENNEDILLQLKNSFSINLLGIEIKKPESEPVQNILKYKTYFKNTYRVLTHPSARIVQPEYYKVLADTLNGRTVEGARALLNLRPELKIKSADIVEPMQIKSLLENLNFAESEAKSISVFRALAELIK